jgi:hypothetical protein
MKKSILLFCLATFLFTLSASAQYKKFTFGLKAAPQISWIKPTTDKYEGDGAIIGFGWGFVSEVNLTENHSLATGFNVLFNGGKYQFPGSPTGVISTGTTSRKLLLKSLEVPVSLKMRTDPVKNITYFGQIGFGQNFLLSAKSIDEYGGLTITNKEAKAAFLRESLIIGGGAEYDLDSGTTLAVNISFDNGFTNVLKNGKGRANFMEVGFTILF